MLGSGTTGEAIDRGIALGAHAVAVDGGSTDSGPHYLGAAAPKMPAEAIAADLRVILPRAAAAGIPVIVGSAGTGGTDAGVAWMAGIVATIAAEEGLRLRVARISSEQSRETVLDLLDRGRISPLPPAGPLTADTVRRCEHIVGLMGAEPIIAALDAGADVVIGGRATDTAVIAAVPLRQGRPAGPAWHAAKTSECGTQCTTTPRGGGVLVSVDDEGFTVEALDPAIACTPTSVAAHMIYENADPHLMREPSGTLDVTDAVYTALDDRRVRVTGSRFVPQPPTVKLEGSGIVGYQSMALAGIRDPEVLASIDVWAKGLEEFVVAKVHDVLGRDDVDVQLRCYGWNAVLGDLDPDTGPPREVGAVLVATAPDQETATKVVKLANPYLLHMPLPGMHDLPSFAFLSSPAEVPRGPLYEFLLQHVVAVDDPLQVFRTEVEEVGQ